MSAMLDEHCSSCMLQLERCFRAQNLSTALRDSSFVNALPLGAALGLTHPASSSDRPYHAVAS